MYYIQSSTANTEPSHAGLWLHGRCNAQAVSPNNNLPTSAQREMERGNLVGRKFGYLTVARFAHSSNKQRYWVCKCDCGNEVIKLTAKITATEHCSRACPLLIQTRGRDITGQRFGKLVALERVRVRSDGKALWSFQCDCGNKTITLAKYVRGGDTTSCGCWQRDRRVKHGLSRTPQMLQAATARWAKRNPHRIVQYALQRDAAVKARTPKWLNDDDLRQIDAHYLEAARKTRETGIPHQVDHIIPLRGRKVSGLHVPQNLRVVTRSENVRKHNKVLDELC
jgi:hypothetical protein